MSVQVNKHRRVPAGCCGRLERSLDARLFRALSDPTRLRILAHLTQCSGACSVTDAATCCNVDFSVVSRHLSVLQDAGILEGRKQGRSVRYAVRYAALSAALRALADAIDECCPEGECCTTPGVRSSRGRRGENGA
ncbi:MAG: metalloregulator ArsR/SmtB family transcription factor [Phycisphaerae bacterium]